MISEELLQQWLDALETCMQVDQQWQIFDADKVRVATKSLRAAIAQPESEPVGTVDEGDDGLFVDLETPNGVAVKRGEKLYTAHRQAALVPLTPDEDNEDEEGGICPSCNGSGEGRYDGSSCSSCGGSGEERGERDPDDFDEPEEREINDGPY